MFDNPQKQRQKPPEAGLSRERYSGGGYRGVPALPRDPQREGFPLYFVFYILYIFIYLGS